MILRNTTTGEQFNAEVFDGTHLNAVAIPDADPVALGYQVVVDSPSGEKVDMTIGEGTLLLVSEAGKVHVAHPSLIGTEYEEVSNG